MRQEQATCHMLLGPLITTNLEAVEQCLKRMRQKLAGIGQNLGASTMEGSMLVFDVVRKTAVGHNIGCHRLLQVTIGFMAMNAWGACLQEQELAVSGRNWGAAAVEGSTLVFTVGSKPAFRVPLKDVGGVQQAAQEARSLS